MSLVEVDMNVLDAMQLLLCLTPTLIETDTPRNNNGLLLRTELQSTRVCKT